MYIHSTIPHTNRPAYLPPRALHQPAKCQQSQPAHVTPRTSLRHQKKNPSQDDKCPPDVTRRGGEKEGSSPSLDPSTPLSLGNPPLVHWPPSLVIPQRSCTCCLAYRRTPGPTESRGSREGGSDTLWAWPSWPPEDARRVACLFTVCCMHPGGWTHK